MKIKYPNSEENETLDELNHGDVFCFEANLSTVNPLYIKVHIQDAIEDAGKIDIVRLTDGKWTEQPGDTEVFLVDGYFQMK